MIIEKFHNKAHELRRFSQNQEGVLDDLIVDMSKKGESSEILLFQGIKFLITREDYREMLLWLMENKQSAVFQTDKYNLPNYEVIKRTSPTKK